ncbi:YicC/YloC family endoribonuclease [Bacillaceae bacterium W0354]
MVKSMTGFGQATKKLGETQITIEIKTVNHRFLDLSFRMPRDLSIFEEKMKKVIQTSIKRGRVDVFVKLQGESLNNQKIDVNWNLLDQYLDRLNDIQLKRNIKGELNINDLLLLEDLFTKEEQTELDDQFESFFINMMDEVIKQVTFMRIEEGKSLKLDIISHLEKVRQVTDRLQSNCDRIKEQYRDKIVKRIEEHLKEIDTDDSRIYQEAAILAEKGDITEEITRLVSHIDQFEEIIKSQEPIGRKLDFLTQELLREANTIGSKSNDVSISKHVVELKSEIEKIKEQVQNIE